MNTTIRLSGVTPQQIARALEFSGFAISNTLDPNVYVIAPATRRLPPNVVEFERPTLLRRQAE